MQLNKLKKNEINANLLKFSSENELKAIVQSDNELIPEGADYSCGEGNLNFTVVSTQDFNSILSFDENQGVITCESGVRFSDILNIFLPKGWILPVIPEAKFITVGGAIASDVHGKNHYKKGSFSNYLISFDIMLADGSIMTCSRAENTDLFLATCGGMGLTGIILRAAFKLLKVETSYMYQESIKARNLEELLEIFEYSRDFDYSAAWVDNLANGKNLGRGIVIRARHAVRQDLTEGVFKKQHSIPTEFNLLSQKMFNFLYFNYKKKKNKFIVPCNEFFYLFKETYNWNKQFYQDKAQYIPYQFVLPKKSGYEGLSQILNRINKSKQRSFGAALTLFGKQNTLISFPMEGYSLNINFLASSDLFFFLHELDELVLKYNGRLNLAKDARITKEMFEKSYPDNEKFKALKHKFDNKGKFQSLQSKRIGI
ncbi:MAG: hypothetical protein ACD_20C00225G0007 [uncultured bacterium]|nr:MAG: hypothetical protein ACD_20C00225G0007 [uncultured bacterium]HBH17512.1 FAD-linked oxidase [Cyanobacteria bacterium UBA9579]